MTQHEEWTEWLDKEMKKPYFEKLLEQKINRSRDVDLTPQKEDWFTSLRFPDMSQINVILVGNQTNVDSFAADGFAFSSIYDADREAEKLYRKLEQELGVVYNREDNTKTRWLNQGILCYPFCQIADAGHLNYSSRDWHQFSSAILRHWLDYKRPMAFAFLDRYTQHISTFLWDKHELPHFVVSSDINKPEFWTTPIFKPITQFIKETYGYEMNWR